MHEHWVRLVRAPALTLSLVASLSSACSSPMPGGSADGKPRQEAAGQTREALTEADKYSSPSQLPFVIEKPLPHESFGMEAGSSVALADEFVIMGAYKDGDGQFAAPGGAYVFQIGSKQPLQHLTLESSYSFDVYPWAAPSTKPVPVYDAAPTHCDFDDTRGAKAGRRLAASSEWVALAANYFGDSTDLNPYGSPCGRTPAVFLAKRNRDPWSPRAFDDLDFVVPAPFGDDVRGIAVGNDDLVLKTQHGVFFFTFDGSQWTYNNSMYGGATGYDQLTVEPLALDGNVAVLGDHQSSRVIVFKKQSDVWQEFTTVDGPGGTGFATDVDIDRGRLLVVAHDFVDFYALSGSGETELIQRNTEFIPSSYGRGAISGNRAIVTAGPSGGEDRVVFFEYVESEGQYRPVGTFDGVDDMPETAAAYSYEAQEVDILGNSVVGGWRGFNSNDGENLVGAVIYDRVENPFDTRATVLDDAEGERIWMNTGEHRWLRHSGPTPSGNTGPSSGADGSNYYYYVETSGSFANSAGDTAVLESDEFWAHGKRLDFDYHMFGNSAGTLLVDVFVDGNWLQVWDRDARYSEHNADEWRPGDVELSAYSGDEPLRVRFRYVAIGGFTGDVALDNIRVSGAHSCEGQCGGFNAADQCWCDDRCEHYGDCCSPDGESKARTYFNGVAQQCSYPQELPHTQTLSGEYKFPAQVYEDVLDDRETELWARVYAPAELESGRRYPLLVFLHGNHSTCGRFENPRKDDNRSYTTTGECPEGYVVVPNHDGYGYIAEELAARDYVVVSINANRGITGGSGASGDGMLIHARAKLVLKHLQILAEWDRGDAPTPASLGFDLRDQIDFGEVGLMGHSRGGHGVRRAYMKYYEEGSPWPARIGATVNIGGIFEIAPVDSGTEVAQGVAWAVLLPMCDAEVSHTEGLGHFERSLMGSQDASGFYATLSVWGTNHRYFNSEWQYSDASGCYGHAPLFPEFEKEDFTYPSGFHLDGVTGSAEQQKIGAALAATFFMGSVGANKNPAYLAALDPLNTLPQSIGAVTRVDRGLNASPNAADHVVLEDFVNETGHGINGDAALINDVFVSYGAIPGHSSGYRGATITWGTDGSNPVFEPRVAGPGDGVSLVGFDTLDFRVDMVEGGVEFNQGEHTDFTVRLVSGDGSVSDGVYAAQYGSISGPERSSSDLQTLRIPLADFGDMPLHQVRGVRFEFNLTDSGAIYLGSIRAARRTLPESASAPALQSVGTGTLSGAALSTRVSSQLSLGARTDEASAQAASVGSITNVELVAGGVDITVASEVPFIAQDAALVLEVGGVRTDFMEYVGSGDMTKVKFKLNAEQARNLVDGALARVTLGQQSWQLGAFDLSAL